MSVHQAVFYLEVWNISTIKLLNRITLVPPTLGVKCSRLLLRRRRRRRIWNQLNTPNSYYNLGKNQFILNAVGGKKQSACLCAQPVIWLSALPKECWDNRSTCGCSPARSSEGKALCKENSDCCKAIIVTVRYNTEVINQLMPAVHACTLIEEGVNGRIQQSKLVFFSLSNICLLYSTFLCYLLISTHRSVLCSSALISALFPLPPT